MTPTLDDLNPDFRDLLHALVEMFLRNKLAAGRPKDLADVARLKKVPR